MTGEVINLREFRKKKQREDREERAAENRSLFGRTKAERRSEEAAKDSQTRHVDRHLIDRTDEDHDK